MKRLIVGIAALAAAFLIDLPAVGVATLPTTKFKFSSLDLNCLAENIYHESKGEPFDGQLAVAAVTINRYESRKYGHSICSIVYSGSYRKSGCQFSWACTGKKVKDRKAFQKAKEIAYHSLYTSKPNIVGKAEFFHTIYVKPKWAAKMKLIAQIANHKFYEKA